MTTESQQTSPILVLGANGKTGRRVAERLRVRGVPIRLGSRSGEPPFDWTAPDTWAPVLAGARSAYVSYYPDLAVPGAAEAMGTFGDAAMRAGLRRLVLLAGRGEPEAEIAEEALRRSGADLTVLRSTWFAQNFSEDYMLEHVLAGDVRLPAGDVPEPFVDLEDVADVAVEALLDDRHIGQTYELTGARALSFAEAVAEIGAATGRPIRYTPTSIEEHAEEAAAHGVPAEVIDLLTYLFSVVLDGRNSPVADGVQRALGREPRDFGAFAAAAAASGAWDAALAA